MKSPGASENMNSVKANGHEKQIHIPVTEHLKSIPEVFGIRLNEEAPYNLLKSDGDFEVRHYEAQVLAETTLSGINNKEFRETAFKKLAGYIFGENKTQEKMGDQNAEMAHAADVATSSETMAMTTPVLQEEGLAHERTMSFVLPKKYSFQTAPQPLSQDIQLREIQPYDAAVVRYSGVSSPELEKEHETKLMTWIKTQPDLQLNGRFFTAQYDAPFVIPFLRRNEVMVKVVTNLSPTNKM